MVVERIDEESRTARSFVFAMFAQPSHKRKIFGNKDPHVEVHNPVDDNDDIPVNNGFYIVKLTGKRNGQHYVAQADMHKNEKDLFWMNFMRKADIVGEFVWPTRSDDGLVNIEEIVLALTNPSGQ